jgi:hypothetical protein
MISRQGSLLLRPRKGEVVGSVLLSFLFTGVLVLVYNIDPVQSLPLVLGIWVSVMAVAVYVLQNQRQNEKEFQKHPVSFPSPEGGGIVGQYMNRPWQNELAELGRRYPNKNAKKRKKKD